MKVSPKANGGSLCISKYLTLGCLRQTYLARLQSLLEAGGRDRATEAGKELFDTVMARVWLSSPQYPKLIPPSYAKLSITWRFTTRHRRMARSVLLSSPSCFLPANKEADGKQPQCLGCESCTEATLDHHGHLTVLWQASTVRI